MPAAKAPKMLSNPNLSASTNNAASISNAMRTGNCELACIWRLRNARTLGGLAPAPTAAATPTITRKITRKPTSCHVV